MQASEDCLQKFLQGFFFSSFLPPLNGGKNSILYSVFKLNLLIATGGDPGQYGHRYNRFWGHLIWAPMIKMAGELHALADTVMFGVGDNVA